MTNDEQARQRLVDIALATSDAWTWMGDVTKQAYRDRVRREAGFRDSSKGHWCAAGLTAAMEDAGLLVPAPGTPARRGAVALLDWVYERGSGALAKRGTLHLPRPEDCADVDPRLVQPGDIIAWLQHPPPDPAGWRRGHVAVIVAVDDEAITTVGWNEGNAPGRVMKRRLWRDPAREIAQPSPPALRHDGYTRLPRPHETVLYRRPGGLYDIARPVAR